MLAIIFPSTKPITIPTGLTNKSASNIIAFSALPKRGEWPSGFAIPNKMIGIASNVSIYCVNHVTTDSVYMTVGYIGRKNANNVANEINGTEIAKYMGFHCEVMYVFICKIIS